jgi:hypothetical protein
MAKRTDPKQVARKKLGEAKARFLELAIAEETLTRANAQYDPRWDFSVRPQLEDVRSQKRLAYDIIFAAQKEYDSL